MSIASPPTPPADQDNALVSVLSEIARAVAGSLELREVFSRVSEAAHKVLPFEAIVLSLPEKNDSFRIYAIGGIASPAADEGRLIPGREYSPSLAAFLAHAGLVDDVRSVLDPSYPRDRELLESGARAMLRAALSRKGRVLGYLSVVSVHPGAFTAAHVEVLASIADLVTLALEHERLSAAERERRRRHEEVQALIPALAAALDVREVFDQVSEIAKKVVPHDRLSLGLLEEDGRTVRLYAYSGERLPGLPETFRLEDRELARREWDFEIVGDVATDLDACSERCQILLDAGIQSILKVPIRLEGSVAGGLLFNSFSKHRFREDDVEIATRVADQVALAISHQRLSEEARRSAAARAEAQRLEARVASLTEELESRDGYARIAGTSRSWRDVLVQASKVALTETTVLLTGESGTGKEVIARAIHRASPRASGPFVAINCAALPDQLLESELFGYERGAFTGASSSKPGRLEQAAGGVLFLDEVGEMSPVVQAKLLRVLQEREFQHLGGTRVLKADVRVVSATNRDLAAAIARGEFREDLFYRLHVFGIRLPPLRERKEDILPLTECFLAELGRKIGIPAPGVSREARELLLTYPWPGNVRELKNALERALILCDGGLITGAHLPISVSAAAMATHPVATLPAGVLPQGGVDLESVERGLVVQALRQAGNNKSKAARLLGLTRAQLYSRIEKYGIDGGDRTN